MAQSDNAPSASAEAETWAWPPEEGIRLETRGREVARVDEKREDAAGRRSVVDVAVDGEIAVAAADEEGRMEGMGGSSGKSADAAAAAGAVAVAGAVVAAAGELDANDADTVDVVFALVVVTKATLVVDSLAPVARTAPTEATRRRAGMTGVVLRHALDLRMSQEWQKQWRQLEKRHH